MQTQNNQRVYKGIERPIHTPDAISSLRLDEVFVFGSNLQGHHGGGAARVAQMIFGAIWGQGVGLQGQSYAIPTMQGGPETIQPYVDQFVAFAKEHTELFFYVTRIGCGIAGFKDQDIAPLFVDALNIENVCLPESFTKIIELLSPRRPNKPFPGITRTTSIRLYQQGQVRTLADVAMTLNDQHHYSDMQSFIRDFDNVIKAYRERGTVSYEIYKMVEELIRNNEATLFTNSGYLDFDKLIDMVDHLSASDESNPLEVIYSRREKTKMLRLAALLNDMMHYTAASDLMNDLSSIAYGRFNCGDNRFMNDPFRYPLAFFKQGLELLWEEIQDNGYMSNALLEKKMFTEHEESVEEYGLKKVIRNDFEPEGPDHPEVYLPKRIGTAPVYLLDENFVDHCSGRPMLVKSCGDGKGPYAHRTLYEMELIEGIIRGECSKGNYEEIGEYYVPVGDDSKPIFKKGHGKMEFDLLADKKRFLQRIRKNTGQC